ncbi:putative methanogenesis marker protein 6 [Thermoplasmatales archaeon BRNA1]|nr:putative methanogenesis marker protein 6 [Thermoplasmatales archaeon BRNA1]
MSTARETRLLMISPDSNITPDVLARAVHTMAENLSVKETCYGCLVEADAEVMKTIISKVRADYRNEVFTKRRGYPAGDPRRCRAQHGTRPGFAQLEAEWECLPLIQHALDDIDAGNTSYSETVRKKPLPVSELKKICEEFQ